MAELGTDLSPKTRLFPLLILPATVDSEKKKKSALLTTLYYPLSDIIDFIPRFPFLPRVPGNSELNVVKSDYPNHLVQVPLPSLSVVSDRSL